MGLSCFNDFGRLSEGDVLKSTECNVMMCYYHSKHISKSFDIRFEEEQDEQLCPDVHPQGNGNINKVWELLSWNRAVL